MDEINTKFRFFALPKRCLSSFSLHVVSCCFSEKFIIKPFTDYRKKSALLLYHPSDPITRQCTKDGVTESANHALVNRQSTLKVDTVCPSMFQKDVDAERQHRFQFEFHPFQPHSNQHRSNNRFDNCTFLLRLASE